MRTSRLQRLKNLQVSGAGVWMINSKYFTATQFPLMSEECQHVSSSPYTITRKGFCIDGCGTLVVTIFLVLSDVIEPGFNLKLRRILDKWKNCNHLFCVWCLDNTPSLTSCECGERRLH